MSGATSTTPTTISAYTGPQFAERIADLFPRGWCSDDAKQSGNVYAFLLAIGDELLILQAETQYALDAQRIQTETAPELDLASVDFLGNTFPRPAGMSDQIYGQQIIAALFQPTATRAALQNALTALTGAVPRMLEPWSVKDTGAWRNISYWNVDTVANPARWGDGGLRYQGFIETLAPAIPAIGANNPILAWGDSAYWNVPGYFMGIIQPNALDAVNNLVNRLRAYGTVVWLKIIPGTSQTSAVTPSPVSSFTATAGGTSSIMLAWNAPSTGTPPYIYSVLYRQSGTTAFVTGPTSSVNSVTVPNLAPDTSYDFEVIARNTAGSSTSLIVTTSTDLIPPAPAQNLQATLVQATAVTLEWQQPITGSPPFTYNVNYRVTGTPGWFTMTVGQGALTVTVINLSPNTSYDFEVVSTN